MPNNSLRVRFGIIVVIFGLFLAGQFGLAWLQKRFADQIIAVEETNYVINLVAEEFRITSRDLTRYARAFCATKNPDFYRHYHEILDWRSGKIPRPIDLDRRISDRVDRRTISQPELLRQPAFRRVAFPARARRSSRRTATNTTRWDTSRSRIHACSHG